MLALTFFTLLASAVALPKTTTPLSTIVDFCQGTSGPQDCGVTVASNPINATVCNNIVVQGLKVHRLPDRDCTFELFKGSTTCGGSDVSKISLPRGDGSVCVPTGVMDGGRWYHGSGRWTC